MVNLSFCSQNLWRELQALKSIIFEINGYTNNVSTSFNKDASKETNVKSKSNGKRSILNAKSFSSLYYDNVESSTTNGSLQMEAIYNMTDFSLEQIITSLEIIRSALESETADLETEVQKLNREMDSQSESNVFVFNSSGADTKQNNSKSQHNIDRGDFVCRLCNKRSTASVVVPTAGGARQSHLAAQYDSKSDDHSESDVCTSCKEFQERRDAKINGKTNNSSTTHNSSSGGQNSSVNKNNSVTIQSIPDIDLSSLSTLNGNNNQSTDSSAKSTPRSGGAKSSRFRSRLNTARDELFFLDEF